MATNFNKVLEFNKQFGITIHDKPKLDIFDSDPKLIKYRMDLIREEISELESAVQTKNYNETIDALSDILYVVYGMGVSVGCNMDEAFDIVHQSNMSKLDLTESDAQKTVEYYKQHEPRYDSPAYRKSLDNKYYVIYNKSTGKILKSIKYNPVKFDYN